jgi:hypothetical protein
MKTLTFKLTGSTPIIMHNIRLANPLDPIVQQIAQITGKRAKDKTDEDIRDLFKLEFMGGLYYSKEKGIHVPGRVLHAVIVEAAKRQRKGATVDRSLIVTEDEVPLNYDGPKDPEKLWEVRSKDKTQPFVDVRGMKPTGRGVVQRCRPIFRPPWSLTFTVEFDENELDESEVTSFMEVAGSVTGMLDDRPRGGRFEVEVLKSGTIEKGKED